MSDGRRNGRRLIHAGLWLAACSAAACGRAGPDWPVPCAATADCPSGYHCGIDRHCRTDIPCGSDDDCCLAERCEGRICQARTNCSAHAPCAFSSQSCAAGICIASLCLADANCQGGARCWDGRCVQHLPCAGSCAQGEACAVSVDRCVALHSAQPDCAPGTLRVLADADRLSDGCQALPEATHCVALPPLPEGEFGTPSVALSAGATLAVVGYDVTYGDVVLARHDPLPPFARRDLQVLTGLPEVSHVSAAVNGPRGGVADPGPDRGRVLAAAVDSGRRLVVALRDDSADTLRYLRRDATGQHEHVISGLVGIGAAIALVIDPQDRPAVLALAPQQGKSLGRLRLFRATTAFPAAATDWQAEDLAVEALPAAPTATAPLDGDLPDRGAWLDLARGEDGLWTAAAYSPLAGDLRVYHQQAAGGWKTLAVPAAAVPGGSGDVGRFVSLQVQADGRALLACQDHARGRLLLVQETASGFVVRVLDAGDRPDGHHDVGADARLVRHSAGGLYVLHQDTRRGDLLATHLAAAGAQPTTTILQAEGAAGFSPALCAIGSKAWIASGCTLTVDAAGQVHRRMQFHGLIWQGD